MDAFQKSLYTPKQKKLYDFICKFHKKNGYGPSYKQMSIAMGKPETSRAPIFKLLSQLHMKGYIYRQKGVPRSAFPMDLEQVMIKKYQNFKGIEWAGLMQI